MEISNIKKRINEETDISKITDDKLDIKKPRVFEIQPNPFITNKNYKYRQNRSKNISERKENNIILIGYQLKINNKTEWISKQITYELDHLPYMNHIKKEVIGEIDGYRLYSSIYKINKNWIE